MLKVVASYTVFITVGLLLSFVPAGKLGLSEEVFFNLRMFFMLFGPVYLTLLVKIILTFLAVAKRQEQGAAEKSQGVLFAVTALLLFANLSTAETVSDFTDGYIQGKGLRNLEKSKRYSLKGKRFLNVFLPVCLYLLSGYQGDKAEHREKRTEEKQKAVLLDMLVLETDPARRKRYLRLPKILALLVCPGVCIVSGFVLYLTKNSQNLFTVQLLRLPFMALMAAAVFSFIPLLMYWANCSGTSLVQRIYLTQDQLYYTGYSGSMEERVEFTFTLGQLEDYHVGKRSVRIRGQFTKKTKDGYGTSQKGPFPKTLWIPRTFPVEQEQALLQFLKNKTLQVHQPGVPTV